MNLLYDSNFHFRLEISRIAYLDDQIYLFFAVLRSSRRIFLGYILS